MFNSLKIFIYLFEESYGITCALWQFFLCTSRCTNFMFLANRDGIYYMTIWKMSTISFNAIFIEQKILSCLIPPTAAWMLWMPIPIGGQYSITVTCESTKFGHFVNNLACCFVAFTLTSYQTITGKTLLTSRSYVVFSWSDKLRNTENFLWIMNWKYTILNYIPCMLNVNKC